MRLTKRCGRCRIELPIVQFNRDASTSDGLKNRCKECRKFEQRRLYATSEKHRAYNSGRTTKWRGTTLDAYLQWILATGRARAKRRGREFLLTKDWIREQYHAQGGFCAYTGFHMTWASGHGQVDTNISLDRLDTSLGYTPENTVLCCYRVNVSKGRKSLPVIMEVGHPSL